jgi:hypothetical protein
MKQVFWSACLLCAWVSAGPALAQFCKWVDADGVTHYAEECPGAADAEPVEIQPPPPPERIEEAQRRNAEMTEEMAARQELGARAKAEALARRQAREQTDSEAAEECAEATMNLATLGLAVPVYYDAQGKLQHDRSRRSRADQGPKTYLDNQDRATETQRFQQRVAATCSESGAGRAEVGSMLVERVREDLRAEICADKRFRLAQMQGGLTGIPPPAVRELRKDIEQNCN